jgi:pimeloyl-ACP methyl ester carboxylesterase
MPSLLLLVALPAQPAPAELPTKLWQVAPDGGSNPWLPPATPAEGGKARAVVLIPGLSVHPFVPTKAMVADLRKWAGPKSELVKALAADADVFAFGYAQTMSVDDVARAPGLLRSITQLRKAGYKEIVLIGHSAGGVIARQFAEHNPTAGVTKIIAVSAPFAGAEAATFKVGYPKVQKAFVQSLTPDARVAAVRANQAQLDKDVEFACVVCKLKHADTDGLVFVRSQWPDDLQKRGVPVELVPVSHVEVMHNAAAGRTIAKLARETIVRWSPEEAEVVRKLIHAEPRERREGSAGATRGGSPPEK